LLKLRMQTVQSQVVIIEALGADYVAGADGDINLAVHKSRI